ncbi:winged helix-turn-helix domain-containing protein [Natronococcus wangiae]|uniref:winged helix-turn-helix domain-containing protein n=1 Tax=Natronococcus wangiae TaxID=3068275 RepID=UPI00273D0F3B|nr:helix-turn-helix domain-containing protein [Natronococcus sp. AD5]
MAQSTTPTGTPPIEQLRTLVDLLENPTLARIYIYVLQTDGATVENLITNLDIPQGTAYDYTGKLEEGGLITKTREERPYEFAAEPLSITLTTDGEARTITAELVDAVGRREVVEDIDVYLDRHGIDGLATALEYAHEYVDGTVNHRIMARELDLSPLEAEIILQALEPVVLRHRNDE